MDRNSSIPPTEARNGITDVAAGAPQSSGTAYHFVPLADWGVIERLQEVARSKGLTVRKLAGRARVSKSTVMRFFGGNDDFARLSQHAIIRIGATLCEVGIFARTPELTDLFEEQPLPERAAAKPRTQKRPVDIQKGALSQWLMMRMEYDFAKARKHQLTA